MFGKMMPRRMVKKRASRSPWRQPVGEGGTGKGDVERDTDAVLLVSLEGVLGASETAGSLGPRDAEGVAPSGDVGCGHDSLHKKEGPKPLSLVEDDDVHVVRPDF